MSGFGFYKPLFVTVGFFIIVAPHLYSIFSWDHNFAAEASGGSDELTDEVKSELTSVSSCAINSKNSLMLVSTLDGGFFALDSKSGKLVWKLREKADPLLSSSLSSVKLKEDIAKLKFVPSLDGSIYQLKKDKIEEVPLSAELLLGRFQKLPDGTHIVGGKEIKSYGIDAETGKMIYKCNINGCKPVSKQWHLSERDVFVVRRTQQIIRAVSQSTGEEKWNFSVGAYDVSYMDHPDHLRNCDQYDDSINFKIRFNIAHGLLEAVTPGDQSQVAWSFKFDSPIADVWRFHDKIVQSVDIFRHGLLKDLKDAEIPDDPVLYLGVHDGQMYAQSSKFSGAHSLPSQSSSAPEATLTGNEVAVFEQPYIGTWRPYIGTSPSRTPSLMNENSLTVWNQLDYPFDNGFCMIALKRITKLKELSQKEEKPLGNKSFSHPSYTYDVVPVSLVERWREILALAVFISMFLQYTIFKFVWRRWRSIENQNADFQEPIKRVRSVTASVSTSTEPTTQAIENEIQRFLSTSEYLSRYMADFDHIECIGKGGFGVVFKATNKIDGCDYAVKRIYLPNCDEAREKVTREVKALAKLDYPGIVRFFHSWWESPPKGWQETTDKQHLMSNIPDGPNIGFPKEWYIHIQSDEDDASNGGDSSDESGITIQRKRNKSSQSLGSKRSSKSIGDDPLGKKVNDFLGIVEDISSTDLLEHNDVFDDSNSEDSFNIEFQSENITDAEELEESNEKGDSQIKDLSIADDIFSQRNGITYNDTSTETSFSKYSNTGKKFFRSRMSTKLVGRCCCKSEDCIKSPPLYLYIQMQLCMSSTLKDWLNKNSNGRQRGFIMDIFKQILNAVEYCHGQGMMHRDLKPSNIFFAMDGSVKIGDFGLVTAITRPSEGKGAGQPAIDEDHTGNVGTHLYMSPEQVNGDSYSHKVDIYALGLILFELLVPFSTQMERIKTLFGLKQRIMPISFEQKYSTEAKIVRWLLCENPDERPEAKDFRASELFQNICTFV